MRIVAKPPQRPPLSAPAAPSAPAPSSQTPRGSLKSQAARGDLEVLVEVPKDEGEG